MYESVARDFGDSPEAWDLRARRHVLALPARLRAAARLTAARAAVGVYEQGLRAVPSSQLVALLLDFLQQQAAALDAAAAAAASSAGAADAEQQQEQQAAAAAEARDVAEAAGWLRLRTQEALEEAGTDGLLTEALRLDSIAFFLHHGEAHAALAVARAGCEGLPHSAAVWQQRLVLEAVVAADQLAEGGGRGQQAAEQQNGGGRSSDSEGEEEGEGPDLVRHVGSATAAALRGTASADTPASAAPARKRLEGLALQALEAVPAADAAPVWLAAISILGGGGCSLQGLARQLVDAAMRQAKGPVEVSGCWGGQRGQGQSGRMELVAQRCGHACMQAGHRMARQPRKACGQQGQCPKRGCSWCCFSFLLAPPGATAC